MARSTSASGVRVYRSLIRFDSCRSVQRIGGRFFLRHRVRSGVQSAGAIQGHLARSPPMLLCVLHFVIYGLLWEAVGGARQRATWAADLIWGYRRAARRSRTLHLRAALWAHCCQRWQTGAVFRSQVAGAVAHLARCTLRPGAARGSRRSPRGLTSRAPSRQCVQPSPIASDPMRSPIASWCRPALHGVGLVASTGARH